jgi:HSP20 family molecular chaperone IbpA
MTTLRFHERLFPTDLLFKNFFETESQFQSHADIKPNYPCDLFTTDEGLGIEIAAVGLDKKDIKIETAENQIKISYDKTDEEKSVDYIHRGIARRSFNLGWKISPKFNLNKVKAEMDQGLLTIFIPIADEAKPKAITIG